MLSDLTAETRRLVDGYLRRNLSGSVLSHSHTAKTLRRVADKLESREKTFFHSICSTAILPEPGRADVHLRRVAAQMASDGGLNWGRVVALFVFTGTLATALAERGAHEEIGGLTEALVIYLSVEKREWLEAHGGWEGFYRYFNKHGSDSISRCDTKSNTIIATAGFVLAGLAFLMAVR
ncbi:anti-apoptotic protein NR13-like [Heteronotia binoei]|uniref:anti-apoptotic protein NR13-like n=1 Tax=Heteronotia binoei TaxID=13085 RepID=UPI002931CFC4|nr:anti-apoptotic protein NR13-like [Heteronotia binoei]XP_060100683.1 anti-apoptotic protein NR13-like [Heteronotia binoei]XP_060104955.1 anti-apoptotic protein NR13-like [Heteronotia binoei]XP_060104956.1 anti-apoptotic protein NR13-like [Heteronotia binoei]XP_060107983.1 anti-apoptotic protein NR13-like [Heteronotia binoei]XP_060109602.1 anti-apoptotic protein NR13-like [Heteronotia binoei]XP_060114116.1 anti-apoptotic protein NR13-like [Heteronotia binoei]